MQNAHVTPNGQYLTTKHDSETYTADGLKRFITTNVFDLHDYTPDELSDDVKQVVFDDVFNGRYGQAYFQDETDSVDLDDAVGTFCRDIGVSGLRSPVFNGPYEPIIPTDWAQCAIADAWNPLVPMLNAVADGIEHVDTGDSYDEVIDGSDELLGDALNRVYDSVEKYRSDAVDYNHSWDAFEVYLGYTEDLFTVKGEQVYSGEGPTTNSRLIYANTLILD